MSDLLEVRDLRVAYPGRGPFSKPTEVLHGISLQVASGETLGLVGESGSGKTTLGRAVLGLVDPSAGSIVFDGEDTTHLARRERRRLARDISVVFQDPYTSLNPAMTIADILTEPAIAQGASGADARARIGKLLDLVNLPTNSLERYPREFSGGQRQRVAIARALALEPKLIVCDEPVSALDLTNQARILDLLIEIQERTEVAYLFVSHDLAVIRHISHRVAVMYGGEIVEVGGADEITSNPTHPYTKKLLLSSPVPDPTEQATRREERRQLALQTDEIHP